MKVEFTRDVTVDGTPYKAGDVVELDAIPAGYRDSCLRVGTCVPYLPPKPDEEAPAEAAEPVEEKPVEKSAKKK